MNKNILIFVLLTVVVAAVGIGSAQAEDKLVEDGWVKEYCLSQRNRKDMESINEIRDKRQYYTASKGLFQIAMRHKRQAEDKEASAVSLRLAFAMTINKSQGQSLDKVGLHLSKPVFGHGKLYFALSRATAKTSVRVQVVKTEKQGKLAALTQERTESETAQEDLQIYTEILQLEKYVNSVCQSFLENEDDSQ